MKTKPELVIEALKTGNDLSLAEIANHISETTGQPAKPTTISPVISRLSKPEKLEIGFLIQRRKKPKNPYRYKLVDEALEMKTEELVGLSHKTPKNRFTLEQAIEKYPGIKKYVKSNLIEKPEEEKLAETTEPVQHDTLVDGNQELIEAVRVVLAHGITINVDVNIRF